MRTIDQLTTEEKVIYTAKINAAQEYKNKAIDLRNIAESTYQNANDIIERAAEELMNICRKLNEQAHEILNTNIVVLKYRGKEIGVKKGDYILDNGACLQFIAGDRRQLWWGEWSPVTSFVLTKKLEKQINLKSLQKITKGGMDYYLIGQLAPTYSGGTSC